MDLDLELNLGSGTQAAPAQAPSITSQPTGGEYDGVTPVTLTVVAAGTDPKTYQWFSNVGDTRASQDDYDSDDTELTLDDVSGIFVGDLLKTPSGEWMIVTDKGSGTVIVSRGYIGTAAAISTDDELELWSTILDATSASYGAEPEADTDYRVVVSNAVGRVISNAATVEAPVWFLDEFSGSASDPALDATKWTQRVRTGGGGDLGNGSSSVNTAQAGKMVCQRVSGGSYGVFAGFITAQEPAEDLVISFKLQIDQNAPNNWNELRFKCTDKTANGVTDGPATGYVVQLDMGAACQVRRHDSGWPGTQIGTTFNAGFTLGVESTVIVTVSVLADRVRIVVNVDGVDKITADDTSASRITAVGYTGICLESSTDVAHHTILDDFSVAAA